MASRYRYNHRAMLPPRDADFGYALHLSEAAGTFIQEHEGTLTLLRHGEKLLVTADVKELVRLLRAMIRTEDV